MASLWLPPYILSSPSSVEDQCSCHGVSSTGHSRSLEPGGFACLGAIALPSSGSTLLFWFPRFSAHSALVKLWDRVSYCIAGDSLPSWPPDPSILFLMLTHYPLSLPLTNSLLHTEDRSPYMLQPTISVPHKCILLEQHYYSICRFKVFCD